MGSNAPRGGRGRLGRLWSTELARICAVGRSQSCTFGVDDLWLALYIVIGI